MSTTKTFRTNLRCEACVAKIAPILDADPVIHSWKADVVSPEKLLTITGDVVDPAHVNKLLAQAGYRALGEFAAEEQPEAPKTAEPATSYFPLLLILIYLLAGVAAFEWSAGSFDWMRAMRHFMAGFFLVFSFFKLLDVPAFADAFSMYDILAKRSRGYALLYPFIELGLGLAYLANLQPLTVNLITLIVMGAGAIGVTQSLLERRKIRCACLGAVFNLPMSKVTLIEDVLMAGMAAMMLFQMLTPTNPS